LKRIYPLLNHTLKEQGVNVAIKKFNELQNDASFNKSEIELIFFAKSLYYLQYYQELEKK